MAAFDTYTAFTSRLPERDLAMIKDLREQTWSDLLSARSEEARLRVVEVFIREVNERLTRQKA